MALRGAYKRHTFLREDATRACVQIITLARSFGMFFITVNGMPTARLCATKSRGEGRFNDDIARRGESMLATALP